MQIIETDTPLFLEPTSPLPDRVQDLLSRLTLAEKISQMTNQAAAIPRLGIPAYDYWSEGLHGVARNGRATVFPQAIGMAATWDSELIRQIGSTIGDEARAKYRAALERNGATGRYQGLTIWSPNINIFRDPRWGRGQETWGEDPTLTGEMGAAFVRGLQGDDPKYLKTAACAKHFAVHSGPEKLRHGFDARISAHDLYDTYLPAFKKLVMEAKVEAVMGAYNRVDGVPACASQFLLTQTLREQWGFDGHVVSDCWALSNIHQEHHYTKGAVETAAVALKAGCDLSCMCTYEHLGEAIERGLITEADIDRALSRTLATRFKLGMFDPSEDVPFNSIPLSVVNSPEHRQLAYQAALESIVLLKNQAGMLPIRDSVRSIAIVGPNAADQNVLLGNYYGMSDTLTTLLEGIIGAAPEGVRVEYRPGSLLTQKSTNPINWSLHEAAEADLTIACMGLSPLLEGEEGEALLTASNGDRDEIELPLAQREYLKALVKAGARIVLVLTGGSPIALGDLADKMQAILYTWYPGQEGGRAVGDILFGRATPSGKLPVTFPQSTAQLPPFEDYSMIGRTYRYATAEPLYPFGFGLSYTNFEYRNLTFLKHTVRAGETLNLSFSLTNCGERDGAEVVQVYLKAIDAPAEAPLTWLVDFRRIELPAGQETTVEWSLPADRMMLIEASGRSTLAPGEYELTIGGCSPGRRGRELGAPTPVIQRFLIQG
jgi:beta-glucosidase